MWFPAYDYNNIILKHEKASEKHTSINIYLFSIKSNNKLIEFSTTGEILLQTNN